MTAVDIVVIVAGLLFGYRLVSNYLTPNTGDRQAGTRPRDDSSQQDWQRHWAPAAPNTPSWFEVLGVAETAEAAEIERAYRMKISQYHPDKVAQLGEDIRQLAEAKSKEINAAYDAAMRLRRR
jgi:DnaJ-domain-containing protein 1